MMSLTSMITIVYGIIVITGGVIGYMMANSIPSLVMGGLLGSVAVIAGIGIALDMRWGFPLAFSTIFILTIFFAYRFIITMKVMPSGIMLIVSLIALSLLIRKMK